MTRFLLVITLCLFGQSAAHAACTDDPRLVALNAFVDQLDAGQAVEPLALTPRTFLDMNPYLRRALGDRIVLQDPETCAPQELVAGMAVTRTTVPFSTLFNRFMEAVIAQDTIGQRVILASFLAEPLPVEQVMGLGGRTGFPPSLAGALAAAAGLDLHVVHGRYGFGDPVMSKTKDPETGAALPRREDISLLDFFVRFGGETTDPGERVYGRIDYCDRRGCNFWDVHGNTHLRMSRVGGSSTALNAKRLMALWQATGLEVIDGGHISGGTKVEYRRQYLAERTAAAGPQTEGAAPARSSLFD